MGFMNFQGTRLGGMPHHGSGSSVNPSDWVSKCDKPNGLYCSFMHRRTLCVFKRVYCMSNNVSFGPLPILVDRCDVANSKVHVLAGVRKEVESVVANMWVQYCLMFTFVMSDGAKLLCARVQRRLWQWLMTQWYVFASARV